MIKISEDIFLGKTQWKLQKNFLEDYDKILVFYYSVYKIHGEKIKNICLKQKVGRCFLFVFQMERNIKILISISSTIAFMIEKNFTKKISCCLSLQVVESSVIWVAIASIYMRGIDFIQIPTSLLAQVDASMGEKQLSILIMSKCYWSFQMPRKFLLIQIFLKTLSKKEFLSGLVELIKHGFLIKDRAIYVQSNELNDENLLKIIEQSLRIKKDYVDKDPEKM